MFVPTDFGRRSFGNLLAARFDRRDDRKRGE